MQVDKRTIESSLTKKGFIREETSHHTYFYHEYNGKRTGITTYTSHGNKIKTYSNPLLSMMKRQLKLDNLNQVNDLFKCPISQEQYNQILKDKKLLTN
jgi:hypothetical protein